MNKYLVLKTVGTNARRICVTDLSTHKKLSVRGNIPQMYHGMIVGLEINGGEITEYEIDLSLKNRGILEKNGEDFERYKKALDIHRRLYKYGVPWAIAKTEMEQIYENLPFPEADKIHKEIVNNSVDTPRLEALKREVLNTGRRRRKIMYNIDEYLSYFDEVEQQGAYRQLMATIKMLCLQGERYGFANGKIIDTELKEKEDYIRNNIEERKQREYRLLTYDEIEDYKPVAEEMGLAEEQIAVLDCLNISRPCIVTGGAGCGKTTVIKAIIECYTRFYKKENILLVAPTGKASRRLAEKTGLPASTIHKALRKTPDDNFTYYKEANKLPHRLVIVDESSMIDTSLMYDLLSAVELSSKIIFVGDHNQLYPVGYGEPFFDFLSKNLRDDVYRLELNHRQSEETDILRVANDILENRPITSGKGVTVKHISFDDIPYYFPKEHDDTQIISPYNQLNDEINKYVNISKTKEFSVGDKVMTVRNTKKYSNGDIGKIKRIDNEGITVEIEDKDVVVPFSDRKDLVFAYSITVHKMQGSEADKVICFIPENDTMVEKRLMYTAVTRAKKELEVYYFTEECSA